MVSVFPESLQDVRGSVHGNDGSDSQMWSLFFCGAKTDVDVSRIEKTSTSFAHRSQSSLCGPPRAPKDNKGLRIDEHFWSIRGPGGCFQTSWAAPCG